MGASQSSVVEGGDGEPRAHTLRHREPGVHARLIAMKAFMPKDGSGAPGAGPQKEVVVSEAKRVLHDMPKNVFGPGHTLSPSSYADVHRGQPYTNWLLEFSKLERERRESCFETLAHFQGKMGLLLREVDRFQDLESLYPFFLKLREVTQHLFNMGHMRIWQFDPLSRSVVVIYNDDNTK